MDKLITLPNLRQYDKEFVQPIERQSKANLLGIKSLEHIVLGQIAEENLLSGQAKEVSVPSRTAPKAVIETLGGNIETDATLTCRAGVKGKTYKYNQLVNEEGNFTAQRGTTSSLGNNEYSFLASEHDGQCFKGISVIQGHKYLTKISANIPNGYSIRFFGGADDYIEISGIGSYKDYCNIFSSSYDFYIVRDANYSDFQTIRFKNPMLVDLTEIYGAGNEPTTVSQFLEDYPQFNSYVPYTTGTLVSPRIGNEWDEEWELGDLHYSYGTTISNSNGIRSKNFIPVTPSTDYHKYCGGSATCVYWYDKDKNFVERDTNGNSDNIVVTSPSNAYYMKFSTYSNEYGSTYNHDIVIYQETPSIEYMGENLIGMVVDNQTINGVTFTKMSDGSIHCQGTATGTIEFNFIPHQYMESLPLGTYYLSNKGNGDIVVNRRSTSSGYIGSYMQNRAITTTSDDYFTNIYIYIQIGSNVDYYVKPMLVKGSTAPTEFKPYNAQSIEIPATTLNGTDEIFSYVEGNQLVTKKVTRYGEVDLSTLTWQYQNDFYAMVAEMKAGTNISGYCDKYATTIERYTEKSVLLGLGNNYIFITDSSLSSTDKPSGKLVYELATPTVTEISRVTLTCDFEKVENVISAELAKQNVEKGVVKATMCDKVETLGVNIINPEETYDDKYVNTNGSITTSQGNKVTRIKVIPSTIYTMSMTASGKLEAYGIIRFENESKEMIENSTSGYALYTFTFTTPSGCHYLAFNSTEAEERGLMIVKGSTAPATYTPYFKHSYLSTQLSQIKTLLATNNTDITLGHIDFEKRKFVVEKAKVDLGELDYNIYNNQPIYYIQINGAKKYGIGYCSKYTYVNELGLLLSDNKKFNIAGSNDIWISDNDYTNSTAFKNSVKGLYLTYELATPYEIDLSDILNEEDDLIEIEENGTINLTNKTDYKINTIRRDE